MCSACNFGRKADFTFSVTAVFIQCPACSLPSVNLVRGLRAHIRHSAHLCSSTWSRRHSSRFLLPTSVAASCFSGELPCGVRSKGQVEAALEEGAPAAPEGAGRQLRATGLRVSEAGGWGALCPPAARLLPRAQGEAWLRSIQLGLLSVR